MTKLQQDYRPRASVRTTIHQNLVFLRKFWLRLRAKPEAASSGFVGFVVKKAFDFLDTAREAGKSSG